MKPFLMIAIRDEDDAVEAEREVILRFGNLTPDELVHVRAEQADLPPLSLDDFTGIIIGGSPFNTSDDDKTHRQTAVEAQLGALVDEAIANDFPVLGICYGVGLVTQRLGGLVDRRYGESPGAVEVRLTQASAYDPLFIGVPQKFSAFTGHKEACAVLPPEAVLLATGENCPVQAYRVGRNVYVTQFHAELDAPALAERLRIYQNHGYFDPEELDRLITEAHEAGVGPEAGRIIANFCARARLQASA